MKFQYVFLFVFCFALFLSAAAAAEKPSREAVIAFVEKGMKEPVSEAEQKLAPGKRKPVDLTAQFGTDFTGIDFRDVEWGGFLYMLTRIPAANDADFSQCLFSGSQINYGALNRCKFDGTDLTDAVFYSCKFDAADFSNARFGNTEMIWSSFKYAVFSHLKLPQCKMWGCDFSNANLSGTDFTLVEFGAYRDIFTEADCTGADFSGTNLSYADFRNACLKNARFVNTKLFDADFTGANLEGTDFTGANVYAAIFDSVSGIDQQTHNALEQRSVRWLYLLDIAFWGVLKSAWKPVFFVTIITVMFLTVRVLRTKAYSRFYHWAFACNAVGWVVVFATLCMLWLMIFTGAHPVKQMSGGNYKIWSSWLHLFLFLYLGLMTANLTAYFIFVIFLLRYFFRCGKWSSGLFWYLLLTALHCFLALFWLFLFMPDA